MSGIRKTRGRPRKSHKQTAAARENFIACARTLFIEQGYENVSMRKVAAMAGVTPTTLYRYFRNKRHILHFLWKELFAHLSDLCMADPLDENDPVICIKTIMVRYMRYWMDNPDHYRVIFMIEDLSSRPEEDINAGTIMADIPVFKTLIKAIEQGHEHGLFREDDIELIWQTLLIHSQGLVSCLITVREISWRPTGELIEQSIDSTLRGLLV